MKKVRKMRITHLVKLLKRKKTITLIAIVLVAIILSFTTAIVIKTTKARAPQQGETEPTFVAGLILQHFKPEKPTEEETEPVSDEDITQFFEEVINTEDEEALDLSQVEPHAYCEPYDGASRSVSCWGDSMTLGVGTGEAGAYPNVLANLTGLSVYNMGGASETSLQIATRQGAYGMHTDRDIDINEESSSIVQFISDYDGSVIAFDDGPGYSTDASGYSYRANPSNNIVGLCYIDGTPVIASYAGDDSMAISYCPEALSLQLAIVDTGNRRCSKISGMAEVLLGAANRSGRNGSQQKNVDQINPTEDTAVIETRETESVTEQSETETPSETVTEPATNPATNPTTKPTKPTNPSTTEQTTPEVTTEPITEPPTSKILTNISIPAGADVRTRASIDRVGDILVLEIGSNGGWGNNYQVLINQYNKMIDSVGCKYFIVVGDTDDPGTSVGDENQNTPYDRYGNYIGIGDTAWEATLRKAYGGHFVNMRVELIQHGLDYAGLSASSADIDGFGKGFISDQLRSDWTHLNTSGYAAKARVIYEKGLELGYWN